MTLPALTLPVTLATDNLDMTLTAEATNGVEITAIRDKTGASPFSYTPNLDDTLEGVEFDGRLWSITAGLQSSGVNSANLPFPNTTYIVGPKDASEFNAYQLVPTAPAVDAVMFEWRGISIPGTSDGDKLWVRIVAESPAAPGSDIRFFGWFGRESGGAGTITIEDFSYPCITLRSFASIRGGESEYLAAKRLQLLIPNLSDLSRPLPWSNQDFWSWHDFGVSKILDAQGPQRHWFLQFSAVCSVNSDVANEYLRCFIVQTEDEEGAWPKSCKHQLILNGASEVWYKMWLSQYPKFEAELAWGKIDDDNTRPISYFYNSYGPKYAHKVAVLQALSVDWWYDICEYYRTWWKTSPQFLKFKTNSLLSDFSKTPSLLMFNWNSQFNDAGEDHVEEIVPVTSAMKAAITNANYTPTLVSHHQTALGPNQGANVTNPGTVATFLEGHRDAIVTIAKSNWISSIYTVPYEIFSVTEEVPFPKSPFTGDMERALATNRDGNHGYGIDQALQKAIDQDEALFVTDPAQVRSNVFAIGGIHPADPVTELYHTEILDLVAGAQELGAYYLDAVGSSGLTYASYHPTHRLGDANPNPWGPHGTPDYFRGVLRWATNLRTHLNARYPGVSFPLFTEIMGEYASLWDLGQPDQSFYFAQSQILGAELMMPTGLNNADHPFETRNPVPPLWETIHNQDRKGVKLAMWPSLSQLALSSWHPGADAEPGLTAGEWFEFHSHGVAQNMILGRHPVTLAHDWALRDFPVAQDSGGTVITSDLAVDPTSKAVVLADFWKTLVESSRNDYAGQYYFEGEMQRPPIIDHSSALVDTVLNPLRHAESIAGIGKFLDPNPQFKIDADGDRQAPPATYFLYPELASSAFRFENFSFDYPAVLSAFFLNDAEDELGLVLINWTETAADWQGTYAPAIHPSWTEYEVHRLVLGGAPILRAGPLLASAGPKTLRASAAPGGDIYLGGQVPAREVWVIRIQAT